MIRFCFRFGLITGLLLMSCAVSHYDMGVRLTDAGNYPAALQAFKAAYHENPADLTSVRELGVILFRTGKYKQAVKVLNIVSQRMPGDERTLFYLGAACEKRGKIKEAIDAYSHFVEYAAYGDAKNQVKIKVDLLMRRQLEEESRKLLAMESSLDVNDIPDNTVAVLPFKNLGQSPKLNPLEKGITDMLITDLSKVNTLQVVERVRMQKLMEEMNLAQTGMVDNGTAPRVGKLLGVSKLVNGGFVDLPGYKVRIQSGLVDTRLQSTVPGGDVTGSLRDIFKAEKQLVFKVIDDMDIHLSQAEIDAIEVIPTENIFAFMAYCNALDAEDKGLFDDANSFYSKAVQLDPGFVQAQQSFEKTSQITSGQVETAALEQKVSQQTKPDAGSNTSSSSSNASQVNTAAAPVDQMMHTAQVMDQGFLPGLDSRDAQTEQNDSNFGRSVDIEINFTLPADLLRD